MELAVIWENGIRFTLERSNHSYTMYWRDTSYTFNARDDDSAIEAFKNVAKITK